MIGRKVWKDEWVIAPYFLYLPGHERITSLTLASTQLTYTSSKESQSPRVLMWPSERPETFTIPLGLELAPLLNLH